MKEGFLQGRNGGNSNSRLIADIIIIWSLILASFLMYIKVKHQDLDILAIATAVGVIFTSISGPALAFLFMQKRTENKSNTSDNGNS